MVELFLSEFSYKQIIFANINVFGINTHIKKKVQKGPEAPRPIFSEGGGVILKVVGEFWRWWVNSEGDG